MQVDQIVLWSNGMVTCFDRWGIQIPLFNGFHADVLEKALQNLAPDGQCYVGDWRNGVVECPRKCLWHLATHNQDYPWRDEVDSQSERTA